MAWGGEPTKAHHPQEPMKEYRSLSPTKWQCKYHIVFIPQVPAQNALWRRAWQARARVPAPWPSRRSVGSKRGHILADHVHMLLSIPPKLAVSSVVGFIKGKSAIHVARHFLEARAQLRRAASLGEGLLRGHRGPGHRNHPPLHPRARKHGPAA